MPGLLDERGQDPGSVNLGKNNWLKSAGGKKESFLIIISVKIEIALSQRQKWSFRQEVLGNGWTMLYCIPSVFTVYCSWYLEL